MPYQVSRLLTGFILLFAFSGSYAEIIELNSTDNKTIQAEFFQGEPEYKTVLLLHGFLQTNQFHTVKRLANALHDSGYTVLTPTLSLGLDKRIQSLPCEAIHTHNFENDRAEIEFWVDWLTKKTGKNVTLVGHSAGSLPLLEYMRKTQAEKVDLGILISMAYLSDSENNSMEKQSETKARQAIASDDSGISNYHLAFCQTYPTTAKSFMSYHEWNPKKLISLIRQFSDKVNMIIGTEDVRLKQSWRDQLERENIPVTYIPGANHFFDQTHEFDLSEAVENLLE
ncbi:MAG: DUF1749 domain-containing protein [Gammaproteobacteria bacterium]